MMTSAARSHRRGWSTSVPDERRLSIIMGAASPALSGLIVVADPELLAALILPSSARLRLRSQLTLMRTMLMLLRSSVTSSRIGMT